MVKVLAPAAEKRKANESNYKNPRKKLNTGGGSADVKDSTTTAMKMSKTKMSRRATIVSFSLDFLYVSRRRRVQVNFILV